MINSIIQLANIFLKSNAQGKEHNEELKVMRWGCAFQEEINSGSTISTFNLINNKEQ